MQIAAGNMVMGGPMSPPTGAYFLWKGGDRAAIEAYAAKVRAVPPFGWEGSFIGKPNRGG
jgi:hypothetical protein